MAMGSIGNYFIYLYSIFYNLIYWFKSLPPVKYLSTKIQRFQLLDLKICPRLSNSP